MLLPISLGLMLIVYLVVFGHLSTTETAYQSSRTIINYGEIRSFFLSTCIALSATAIIAFALRAVLELFAASKLRRLLKPLKPENE
jgi:hypothetical protein